MFWVPPIISGTDKATNFKFCMHILSIDQNNSPLKISGAVAGCVMRTLKTFKCTHILGASCGLLCDSYAVLFLPYYLSPEILTYHLLPLHLTAPEWVKNEVVLPCINWVLQRKCSANVLSNRPCYTLSNEWWFNLLQTMARKHSKKQNEWSTVSVLQQW